MSKKKKIILIAGFFTLIFLLVTTALTAFFAFFHLKSEKEYIVSNNAAYKEVVNSVETNDVNLRDYRNIYGLEMEVIMKNATPYSLVKDGLEENSSKYTINADVLNTDLEKALTGLKKPTIKVQDSETKLKEIAEVAKSNAIVSQEAKSVLTTFNVVKCSKAFYDSTNSINNRMNADERVKIMKDGIGKYLGEVNAPKYKNTKIDALRTRYVKLCQDYVAVREKWLREVIVYKNEDPIRKTIETKYNAEIRNLFQKYIEDKTSIWDQLINETDVKYESLVSEYTNVHNKLVKEVNAKVTLL